MTTTDTRSLDGECALMLARAMEWVVSHIDEFDPFANGRTFDVAHGQRVTELATMLNTYVALTDDRSSAPVTTLLEEAARHQQNRALTDRIVHSPAEFVLFADLYSAIRRIGHDDPTQRELIQRVIDAGFLDQVERVPHRMMDVRLTLEWGDFTHPWESLESLCQSSILAREPRALYLDEASLYSLTHVIMFLYGFGTRHGAEHGLSPEQELRVRATLSMLLVITAQQHHWDLLIELLLCWDCLNFPVTPLCSKAWETFLALQEPDGALPGPERALAFSDPSKAQDPVRQRELYVSHHYHTTLLAIIAAVVHRGRAVAQRARALSRRAKPETIAAPSARISGSAHRPELEALRRSQRWLIARGVDAVDHSNRAALELLLARWICRERIGGDPSFRTFAQCVARRLATQDASDAMHQGVGAASTTLSLISASILRGEDCLPGGLDQFVSRSAEVLGRTRPPDAVSDLAFAEKRVILSRLGLGNAPLRLSRDELLMIADSIPLRGSAESFEQLAVCVDSFTACGTSTTAPNVGDDWLIELLIAVGMHYLREYDFPRATRLLRAASYLLTSEHSLLSQSYDFLLLHQDTTGAFGFLGPAQDALQRSSGAGFSVDLDARLPVTLQSIWTLAERDADGWRLYASLHAIGATATHITPP